METILLSTADNNVQASLLQSALRNEGIESFLKNEHLSTVFGNIPGFQIEIYVFESSLYFSYNGDTDCYFIDDRAGRSRETIAAIGTAYAIRRMDTGWYRHYLRGTAQL